MRPFSVAVVPGTPAPGEPAIYVADGDWEIFRIQAFGTAYPAIWRGEFYDNRWLAARPLTTTQTAVLDSDWGTGSPSPNLSVDGFSARFQRTLALPGGLYRFSVQEQGGLRLWVDGRILLDQWNGPGGTYTATISLAAGDHPVRLEYNDPGGAASVRLQWENLSFPYHIVLPFVGRFWQK